MKLAITSSNTLRRRWVRVLAAAIAAVLAMSASLSGYLVSREYTEQPSISFDNDYDRPDPDPNRVDITAWVTRIDVATQTATVLIADVTPRGSMAQPDGTFAENLLLETNSIQNDTNTVKKGDPFPNIERRFSLNGVVTDFPFDRYTSYLALRMTTPDGTVVPIAVTVTSTDALFANTPTYDEDQNDWLTIDLAVKRSVPTIVFGVFIMVLMLGLASAAALLCYFLVSTRQGMQYSAYSVMGALLFAMIPLRNAIPGNPPIGSVIDFVAFFIAEAVISMSLITSVVFGYRHQVEDDRAKQ